MTPHWSGRAQFMAASSEEKSQVRRPCFPLFCSVSFFNSPFNINFDWFFFFFIYHRRRYNCNLWKLRYRVFFFLLHNFFIQNVFLSESLGPQFHKCWIFPSKNFHYGFVNELLTKNGRVALATSREQARTSN